MRHAAKDGMRVADRKASPGRDGGQALKKHHDRRTRDRAALVGQIVRSPPASSGPRGSQWYGASPRRPTGSDRRPDDEQPARRRIVASTDEDADDPPQEIDQGGSPKQARASRDQSSRRAQSKTQLFGQVSQETAEQGEERGENRQAPSRCPRPRPRRTNRAVGRAGPGGRRIVRAGRPEKAGGDGLEGRWRTDDPPRVSQAKSSESDCGRVGTAAKEL